MYNIGKIYYFPIVKLQTIKESSTVIYSTIIPLWEDACLG